MENYLCGDWLHDLLFAVWFYTDSTWVCSNNYENGWLVDDVMFNPFITNRTMMNYIRIEISL